MLKGLPIRAPITSTLVAVPSEWVVYVDTWTIMGFWRFLEFEIFLKLVKITTTTQIFDFFHEILLFCMYNDGGDSFINFGFCGFVTGLSGAWDYLTKKLRRFNCSASSYFTTLIDQNVIYAESMKNKYGRNMRDYLTNRWNEKIISE